MPRRKPDERERQLIMLKARAVVCAPFYDTVKQRLVNHPIDFSADRPPSWRSCGGGTLNAGAEPRFYWYDSQGVSVYDDHEDAAFLSWKHIYRCWREQATVDDLVRLIGQARDGFAEAAAAGDLRQRVQAVRQARALLDQALVLLDHAQPMSDRPAADDEVELAA